MKNHALSLLIIAAASALCPRLATAQTILTPIELQPLDHFVTDFTISSAGSTIAFTVGTFPTPLALPIAHNVWTVPRFGNSGRQITAVHPDDGSAVQASIQESEFIAYIRNRLPPPGGQFSLQQIVVTDIGTITPANLHVHSFSWSLDPQTLAFVAREDTQPSDSNGLYTVSITGAGLQKIRDCTFRSCGTPQWSPTENIIAFGQFGEIWLINPNGSGAHKILTNATGPVWSPHTGKLAFDCGSDVCVANQDGSGKVNLTNGFGGLAFAEPSWSFDESLLVVVSRSSTFTRGDLYVVPPNGGNLVQVTNTSNASAPQWSPTLDEIIYICRNSPNLVRDDLCVLQNLGPPGQACDPTTCNGCCMGRACLRGTTASACGVNGASCTACTGGKVCSANGTCQNPTSCNITNCNGCCDASNVCHAGSTVLACGKAAGPCARCVNSEFCDGTQRTCLTQLCSAANCSGCCGADGKCHAGTGDSACGGNGLPCATCTGSARCNTNRVCQALGCNLANCPTGCCDATGVCRPGNTADACGYSGFACLSCGGQECNPGSRTCSDPRTCTPSNCPSGCCGPADNQCHAGSTNEACGFGGFTCQVCRLGENCSSTTRFCN